MRKARRAATTWVDGLYTPRYTVTGDSGGGGIGIGGNALAGGPAGAINPTAANSIQQTESLRRGFVGIEFRPNAFVWRVLGTRNVLAPLNGAALGWPYETERNFGPSGLSVASDRWDVRHAVLLEGALKVENQGFRTVTIYVDYQTQQPLYWITRGPRRRLLDVGVLVYRYSGDRARYPTWEDGSPALVFDPVAASFLDVAGGSGSGWRRESYDVVSIPSGEGEIERLSSVSALSRGH